MFEPSIITESDPTDGPQRTVVSRPTGRFESTSDRGDQVQRYEGKPDQNEANVADALHRLRDTLNEDAGAPLWQEHVGHEHDSVDGTLTSVDGRELKCQVTRVERRTLRIRGREERATSHNDDVALSASVVEAFEEKLRSADRSMILVLDTNDAPAYTDRPRVVEMARDVMRERGYFGRWAEVWLVGPTTRRTTRIDSS